MAYVSLVLDDHDEEEPAGTSDEGHYRCLSCALADSSCGHSAVVMVRSDLDELEGCAHEFEGACLEPPGDPAYSHVPLSALQLQAYCESTRLECLFRSDMVSICAPNFFPFEGSPAGQAPLMM